MPPPVIYIESGTFALVSVAGPGVILYEVVNVYEALTLVAAVAAFQEKELVSDLAFATFTRAIGATP